MKIRLQNLYVYYASVIYYIGSNRHYETPALWRGVFIILNRGNWNDTLAYTLYI